MIVIGNKKDNPATNQSFSTQFRPQKQRHLN